MNTPEFRIQVRPSEAGFEYISALPNGATVSLQYFLVCAGGHVVFGELETGSTEGAWKEVKAARPVLHAGMTVVGSDESQNGIATMKGSPLRVSALPQLDGLPQAIAVAAVAWGLELGDSAGGEEVVTDSSDPPHYPPYYPPYYP